MASIDKKNGKYRVRVSYKDEDGKRKVISRSGIKTKSEANRIAHELEFKRDELSTKKTVPTLYDYVQDYIKIYRENKVSQSSVDIDKWSAKRLFSYKLTDNKKNVITKKVYPIEIPLNKITHSMQQEKINQLIEDGFSNSTIKKTNNLLFRVMEKARVDGYVLINPASEIVFSKNQPIKKAEFIDHDKIEPFLEDVKRRNLYHYFLFRLIIETGLRVGEACALTWQDVDRENNIINVTKSYDEKRDILGETKTKVNRDVYITKKLSVELFKFLQVHNANKIVNEKLYDNKYNFIFVNEFGKPLSRSSIHNTMVYCSEKVLGYKLSIHKLRHTHATLLLESGVPIQVIAERLGHASSEMTEKVYAHVTDKMKKDNFEDFEKYIKTVF
ncbi:site-specific integrase [Macrococcoides goetzii]|nr:site-specific integrase [Macrococcus goetzii]TDM47787.1 site-specific integrase [Macrococcus goetzii]